MVFEARCEKLKTIGTPENVKVYWTFVFLMLEHLLVARSYGSIWFDGLWWSIFEVDGRRFSTCSINAYTKQTTEEQANKQINKQTNCASQVMLK